MAENLLPQRVASLPLPFVADAVWLVVLKLVAWVAKRDAVGYFQAKLWVGRKWLNVVGSQVPALVVTTLLACVFVASEDFLPPPAILMASSVIVVSDGGAIAPVVVRGAADSILQHCGGYLSASLQRDGFPLPRSGSSHALDTHATLCFFGVLLSLERAYSRLRWSEYLDFGVSSRRAVAYRTRGGKLVIPTGISIELGLRFPLSAFETMFQSRLNSILIFGERNADLPGGYFDRSKSRLCHDSI